MVNLKCSKIYDDLVKVNCFNINEFTSIDDISSRYVWFYDMEWMSVDEIINYDRGDGLSTKIIPFARSSGGDLWGWLKDDNITECSVVFCPTDDEEGFIYSPSFIAAIFRHILEFASQNNFCDGDNGNDWEFNIEVARGHINKWIDVFGGYMPNSWRVELNSLLTVDLKLYSESEDSTYMVIISPDEVEVIIERLFDYDMLNNEFVWVDE